MKNLKFFLLLSLFYFLLVGFPPNTNLQQFTVQVFDLITQKPIKGALVFPSNLKQFGITDAQGIVVFKAQDLNPNAFFTVKAKAKGYMGTMETFLTLRTHKIVRIGMPDLNRLEEADAFIRDPRTLDPHREQTFIEEDLQPPTTQQNQVAPRAQSPTYPLPKKIQVKLKSGKIITLDLETYLKGVLPKEIGSSFPMEAKKAQAVAARTYTVSYTRGGKKPICTTTMCQVWGTTRYTSTDQAVDATKGIVAIYNGKITGGYFAASCGGYTINSEQKWSYRPYLRARPCIENKKNYCSVVCKPSYGKTKTCWGIYGHRIGLCQRGAQSMAKCGKKYDEIVKHYYTGVQLANVKRPTLHDDATLTDEDPKAGKTFPPNTTFSKRWRLKNIGTSTWTQKDGYSLIHINGPTMGNTTSLPLNSNDAIAPSAHKDFVVQLTTPSTAGTYKATWQMSHNSKTFGPKLTVDIKVSAQHPKCIDKDKDGYFAPANGCKKPYDCNDNDPNVHPGAREICGNGKDDDCRDGDSQCPPQCLDNDQDGYYQAGPTCPKPYDCDDNDKNVHPGAKEICGNGKDDDCQGGDQTCPSKNCQDKDKDGYGVGQDCTGPQDCDDNDKNVHPGAKEICGNGKDDDCQGGDQTCQKKKLKLGELNCQKHSDCEQGLCISNKGITRCSASCSNANPICPDGEECLQGTACWPTLQKNQCQGPHCGQEICAPGDCVPKGCGCSQRHPSQQIPLLLLLLLTPFLLKIRRR